MNIRSLGHSALLVEDVEKSRQFYTQILRMQEVPRPSNFKFGGAWFRQGTAEIHIIAKSDRHVDGGAWPLESKSLSTHIAFEVDDLQEARQFLNDQNIEIARGPQPRGDGVQQLYVRDPDGYVIELYAWQDELPPA